MNSINFFFLSFSLLDLPQKALEEGVDENLRGYPEFLQVGDTICIQWTDYENLLPTLGPNLKCNDLLVVVPCRSKNNKDYIFSYHLFSRRFGIGIFYFTFLYFFT